MTRPTYDEIYSEVARSIARRATCPRAQVGAVLVDSRNRVIGTGYNGSPRDLAHCHDAGCLIENGHCVRTIHAEANALANAVADPTGSTCYVTHYPCVRCANLLIQAGVARIIALSLYGDVSHSKRLFRAAGVEITEPLPSEDEATEPAPDPPYTDWNPLNGGRFQTKSGTWNREVDWFTGDHDKISRLEVYITDEGALDDVYIGVPEKELDRATAEAKRLLAEGRRALRTLKAEGKL